LVPDTTVSRVSAPPDLNTAARRWDGVPPPLHLDRVEERSVRDVVARVQLPAHDVAGFEVHEAERPGADGLEIGRRLARLVALVCLEEMLRVDHLGAIKGRGAEGRRLLDDDYVRVDVDRVGTT